MDLIPNFNEMTPQEVKHYLHIPKKRKCIRCKGKKEQNNGNAFWCNACLNKNKINQKELAVSRAKFAEFAKDHPNLSLEQQAELYKLNIKGV